MRSWLRICLLILIAIVAGGTRTTASAQTPTVPSDQLGWDQTADDISLFGFAILVDGQRQSTLLAATCTATATTGVFTCVAPLPALTPGVHELRLVAVRTQDGASAESAPSDPLSVNVIVVASPQGLRIVRQ